MRCCNAPCPLQNRTRTRTRTRTLTLTLTLNPNPNVSPNPNPNPNPDPDLTPNTVEDAHYADVRAKLLRACEKMAAGGWWWEGATSAAIKRSLALELATATLVPSCLRQKTS